MRRMGLRAAVAASAPARAVSAADSSSLQQHTLTPTSSVASSAACCCSHRDRDTTDSVLQEVKQRCRRPASAVATRAVMALLVMCSLATT